MKKRVPTIFIIVIFVAGLAVLLYPKVANYIYEKNSAKIIRQYNGEVSGLVNERIQKEKEEAIQYNKNLVGNNVDLIDPFDKSGNGVMDNKYEDMLDISSVMAYLEIPVINIKLPVYHGTDDNTLRKGIGHLESTSLPIGGESTHAVLSGHSGMPGTEQFTNLDRLKEGNIFRIYVLDEILTYQVYNIEVVEPKNVASLKIVNGEDYVTLVTCTPYGVNSHRLLVHGRRIQEDSSLSEPNIDRKFSMEDIIIFVFFIFMMILLYFIKKKKKYRKVGKHEKID